MDRLQIKIIKDLSTAMFSYLMKMLTLEGELLHELVDKEIIDKRLYDEIYREVRFFVNYFSSFFPS